MKLIDFFAHILLSIEVYTYFRIKLKFWEK
jgi:hypothetical protein